LTTSSVRTAPLGRSPGGAVRSGRLCVHPRSGLDKVICVRGAGAKAVRLCHPPGQSPGGANRLCTRSADANDKVLRLNFVPALDKVEAVSWQSGRLRKCIRFNIVECGWLPGQSPAAFDYVKADGVLRLCTRSSTLWMDANDTINVVDWTSASLHRSAWTSSSAQRCGGRSPGGAVQRNGHLLRRQAEGCDVKKKTAKRYSVGQFDISFFPFL
jgi:hypothetical protein